MKPFDQSQPQDNKVIAAEQRQVKKDEFLIGRMRPHPGQQVFEFDLATGQVALAEIETVQATYGGGIRKKIMQKPERLYACAINAKNAVKKFVKMYDRLVKAGHIVRLQVNIQEDLDITDGYLPLEEKPDRYGRTGQQMDNSQGTF